MGNCNRDRILPGKRQISGHHLIDRNAERIDVASLIAESPLRLLRRDIVNRSHRRGGHRLGGNGTRNSKVRHLDLAIPRNHDVLRLDVAVNDVLFMRRLHALCDLNRNADRLLHLKMPFLGDITLERNSLNQLHHDIMKLSLIDNIIDADNVWV